MRKKRNVLKRNSGFIVGCILAAGASFFSADILITEVLPDHDGAITVFPESETVNSLTPEKLDSRTYETDAFTVMASGTVIKGVETESPKKETEEPQTDENGNIISSDLSEPGTSETGTNQVYENDSSTGDGSYSDGSGSGSYSDGSSNGGSYDDGSSNGGSGNGSIEITDPGNGDYSYGDTSGTGSGDYSGSGSNEAWTPDDTIISGICSRYIDVSELYSYGPSKIRLIRNEIFAVHGRIFKSQDLMDYFCQKSWYVPTYNPEDFDVNMFSYLNDYEIANLKLILEYEDWLATQ